MNGETIQPEHLASVREIVIEQLEFQAHTQIGNRLKDSLTVKEVRHMIGTDLALCVHGLIWGKTGVNVRVLDRIYIPKSWWDHIKHGVAIRFKWDWLGASVRYNEIPIKTEERRVCPHLEITARDRTLHLQFLDGEDRNVID